MNNDLIIGFLTGLSSAIVFNPIDKAIYISTTQNINITNPSIWKNCFKGTLITINTRIITSGLYFSYLDYLTSTSSNNLHSAIITSLLCSTTNPLQLIKFHSWYNNISIHNSFTFIKNYYGYKGFLIGITPLFFRDLLFNYLYISYKKKDNDLFNLFLISSSLIIISPINLIKNKKYASNQPLHLIIKHFKFNQLAISQGIFRTTLNFYFSQSLYNILKSNISI